MESLDEAGADPPPTAFDDLLDQLLRGNPVDVGRFLETHPELSADERRQVVTLDGIPRAGKPSPPPIPSRSTASAASGYRKIGAGSMGAVYLAEDESLGRTVAVKILGPDISAAASRPNGSSARSAPSRVSATRTSSRVHAAGEENGLRYMAMELPRRARVSTKSSWRRRASGSRLPVSDVLRWGAEVARALEAAHAAGHRPPGREAVQHPHRHGRPRGAARFRPRSRSGSGDADRMRRLPRLAAVRLAGAGRRRQRPDRRAHRRLLPRSRRCTRR